MAIVFAGMYAQDDDFQTIFPSQVKISGMGGPFMIFSAVDGQFVHLMGGGGGVIVNDIVLGGFGYGSTNHLQPPKLPEYNDLNLQYGFGGFMVGYTHHASRAIHPAFYVSAGWGEIQLNDRQDVTYMKDNIFIILPQLEAEFNFTHFFKLGIGVCYPIATGVDIPGTSNPDFSRPGGTLSLRFGKF